MKLPRLLLSTAVATLFITTAEATPIVPSALTGPAITYVFQAIVGTTIYNGSTITIQDNSLIDFSLNGFSYVVTPANSPSYSSTISFYDSTTWTGNFTVHLGSPISADGVFDPRFEGSNVGTFGTLQLFDEGGSLAPGAAGTWTARPAGVPDAAGSLQLLGIALGGLGFCRRWIRTRA